MLTNDREPDQDFFSDEHLFRRVPRRVWSETIDLRIEAFKLPDVSVGRSKYGHAVWVRLEPTTPKFFHNWGVISIQVSLVPAALISENGLEFNFKPVHVPLEKDYPHSEIRAYTIEVHLKDLQAIPEDVELAFREILLNRSWIRIKPGEQHDFLIEPPTNHQLETP